MKLGLGLDLYRGATLEVPVELVRRAEELGYHSVWTAEAYGSDALSPLAYLAALTTADQARHRGRPARRTYAGGDRDARDDDRRAGRRGTE